MEKIVNEIANLIWSNALVVLALGTGIYFTIITKGVQFRYFFEMIRLLKDKKTGDEGISSFQAFCMSLSGRIGVGNIAGVATAIAAGGPGAILWMNVMALLGGASAFAESTLAQVYKEKIGNEYRGGGPWYIEKGLKMKPFAILVAIVVCISYGVFAPGVQANTIAVAFTDAFDLNPYITMFLIVVPLGFIIFGGIKRIANVAHLLVPFMAIAYLAMMIAVLLFNVNAIPEMLKVIFTSAIGTNAIFGGIVGYAVSWGVRRAIFSNVAGAGEATYSSAAAEVSHPAKQGLVQGFSVYIDTVLVCSATGLMILVTGMYNVLLPNSEQFIFEGLPGVQAGTAFTQSAVGSVFPQFGPIFVALAIYLFAFTCLMAYYYIAETALTYLIERTKIPVNLLFLKIVMLIACINGCIETASVIWAFADIGFGSMSYLNFIAIILLSKVVVKVLKDYDRQKKAGLNPVFHIKNNEIKNADFWSDK